MNNKVELAIIGAGPYGLSIAAHLKARNVGFRIFGSPMHTWLNQMPRGMHLKSEGFASSLFAPRGEFTLADYCKQKDIAYADQGLPVSLENFACYGLAFQKKFVPELENQQVTSIQRAASGFELRLASGEVLTVKRIVAAVGLTHYDYLPPALTGLSEDLVTHSSRHSALDEFKGRRVVVVGLGASAVDIAALLHKAGADVQLVGRKPAIKFHDPPTGRPRSMWQRVRHPMTGIGPGWKLVFCAETPLAFRLLPEETRLKAVARLLGPAPGWFVKNDVAGKVPCHLGVEVSRAWAAGNEVNLELTDASGSRRTVSADHVIAATGYKVDLDRLQFLSQDIRADIRRVASAPALSSNFESSIPGLYFVGTSAANTFGPLMRFAVGAGFVASRLSAHLAKSAN